MSHTTPTEAEITRTLSDLKLSTKTKPKSGPVAESWDDEPLSSDEEKPTKDAQTSKPHTSSSTTPPTATQDKNPITPIKTATTTASPSSTSAPPNPPPPTPSSPTPFEFDNVPYAQLNPASPPQSSLRGANTAPARRPEKTTAVAGRLIAGALGVKAPRRTAEEREYDRAMREKERRRREEERERERREREEAERRKRSVWED
ncbi:uncharacterized protein EI97DRAFT_435990 [Westerdykella ornata]|uniref:Uncharacterized protein n=1 Tax=Westerdykella ornata TaxID=318751 RepID=A0A6A6JC42_WESOR|nr:uncharacterized protein EI97DRAFT_435990 [Westerdykella ornata]KAF2273568.1 hypothetical protein EI97DRAFT_435990 [Westerdykella ornata]